MNKQSTVGFFSKITKKLNESTNAISFERKERIDPDLLSSYFGKMPHDSEIKRLQSMANNLSKDQFLEISIN